MCIRDRVAHHPQADRPRVGASEAGVLGRHQATQLRPTWHSTAACMDCIGWLAGVASSSGAQPIVH
eukprot:11123521-Alexandrium_andersonii.AAC.1